MSGSRSSHAERTHAPATRIPGVTSSVMMPSNELFCVRLLTFVISAKYMPYHRKCVKPSHLFLGTHDDNVADMGRQGTPA